MAHFELEVYDQDNIDVLEDDVNNYQPVLYVIYFAYYYFIFYLHSKYNTVLRTVLQFCVHSLKYSYFDRNY